MQIQEDSLPVGGGGSGWGGRSGQATCALSAIRQEAVR
jgi:hypothetical protein